MNWQHIKQHIQTHISAPCQCCGLYHEGPHLLCKECLDSIQYSNSCMACGKALPKNNKLCGQCLKTPLSYDQLLVAGNYQYPLQQLIHAYKYHKQSKLAQALAYLLLKKVKTHYTEEAYPKQLVAVPLHSNKLFARGYNQSQLLANNLSLQLKIPCNTQAIYRTKDTPSQAGLNQQKRKQNLKNAFTCTQRLPEHLALIDDVVTTNATVSEISKQLKQAGVKRVDIWCLARAQT